MTMWLMMRYVMLADCSCCTHPAGALLLTGHPPGGCAGVSRVGWSCVCVAAMAKLQQADSARGQECQQRQQQQQRSVPAPPGQWAARAKVHPSLAWSQWVGDQPAGWAEPCGGCLYRQEVWCMGVHTGGQRAACDPISPSGGHTGALGAQVSLCC
jgi:hypothetical protein